MRILKKKVSIVSLTLLISGFTLTDLSAQDQGKQNYLTDKTDSIQYVLGAYLGRYINNQGLSITDPDLFLKGMDDALAGREMLVETDSINSIMSSYLNQISTMRNRAIEQELFDSLKVMNGVGSFPSGVHYIVSTNGTGRRPSSRDTITMHIRGYLPEGIIFEDSYARNTPLVTTPSQLVSGMREALEIMPEGSVWRIFIPANEAYGERGVPGLVPASSAVVFDVELLKVGFQ